MSKHMTWWTEDVTKAIGEKREREVWKETFIIKTGQLDAAYSNCTVRKRRQLGAGILREKEEAPYKKRDGESRKHDTVTMIATT